ncbi:hypothetical protein SAMN04490220_1268 [Rhodococcus jostii]|uniref:Uncharacterized protein n=1 Tax=Rhodococcus jostii TaxID=132919 RepID=A0A1H4RBE4_RHOJO|nr:hypothetical protein SAMN04490220_1268 [Rhodococcus jostii]
MPEARYRRHRRSPIGKTITGSLTDIRPDDLTVQMAKITPLARIVNVYAPSPHRALLSANVNGGAIAGGRTWADPRGARPRNHVRSGGQGMALLLERLS